MRWAAAVFSIALLLPACTGGMPGDDQPPARPFEGEPPADGEFLFALRLELAGELPIQFILTLDDTAAPGSWDPRLDLQPLGVDPREPLAPMLSSTHVYQPNTWWGDELLFETQFEDVTIPGAANPNGGAQLQLVALDLFGYFVGPDALCGEIEGYTATATWVPDVGGSFAAVRLDGGELPQEFPVSCEDLGTTWP